MPFDALRRPSTPFAALRRPSDALLRPAASPRSLPQITTESAQPPSRAFVYPGAFFNESVLLTAEGSGGTLYTATAVEDSVMLCVSHAQRQAMQVRPPAGLDLRHRPP